MVFTLRAAYLPGVISFIDFNLTGEGVFGLDHTKTLTLGEMRAHAIGPNQDGTLYFFLPQFSYIIGQGVE